MSAPDTRSASPTVLVVSSHVSVGAVGGRACVFALERLGLSVWSIVTINLPHHPGHGPGTRIVPPAQAFGGLVDDIAVAPWFADLDGLLCGYFATHHQVKVIADLIGHLKLRRPEAVVLCDPVLGDGSDLYVPRDVAEAVRDLVVPRADILTPNLFELGWLSGEAVTDTPSCIAAARALNRPTTIVTSAPAPTADRIANLVVAETTVHQCEHPRLSATPHGTGDLFSALTLGRVLLGSAVAEAVQHAAAATYEAAAHAERLRARELPLAASQAALVRPSASIDLREITVVCKGRPRPS